MAKSSSGAAAAAIVPKRAAVTPISPRTSGAPHLDRVIHERMRLGIISALAANPSLTFNDLKKLLETTDGNLSVHARKLEEAGYVLCTKSFEGRMPRTEYGITEEGRKALTKYIDHMESLIEAMKGNQPQSR
jgi:DNA-binding HxlR family transcriptional regulator